MLLLRTLLIIAVVAVSVRAIEPMHTLLNLDPANSMPTIDKDCLAEFRNRYKILAGRFYAGTFGRILPLTHASDINRVQFMPRSSGVLLPDFFVLKAMYYHVQSYADLDAPLGSESAEIPISLLINDLMDQWPVPTLATGFQVRQSDFKQFWRYIGFVRAFDYFPCSDEIMPKDIREMEMEWERRTSKKYPSQHTFKYLVMENLGRKTLAQTLLNGTWFGVDRQIGINDVSMDYLRAILIQVLSSLWYAYDKIQFTHYDLHCHNIMLHKDPRYKGYSEYVYDFTIPKKDDSNDEKNFHRNSDDESDHEILPYDGRNPTSVETPNGRSASSTSAVRHDAAAFGNWRLRSSKSHVTSVSSWESSGGGFSRNGGSHSHVPDENQDDWRKNLDRDYYSDPKREKTATKRLFPQETADEYHVSLYRFHVPQRVTRSLQAKIIDFGFSRAFDPRNNRIYSERKGQFNPFADFRMLAFSIINSLPMKKLRNSFCIGNYDIRYECRGGLDQLEILEKEYSELTEVLKFLIFAVPRYAQNSPNAKEFNEEMFREENEMEDELNELIAKDLILCKIPEADVKRRTGDFDWIAAAHFAFRCGKKAEARAEAEAQPEMQVKSRAKAKSKAKAEAETEAQPEALKFMREIIKRNKRKVLMTTATMRRQARRALLKILDLGFFSRFAKDE